MIIKTKKGTYISDTDGMLLTDGMSFGIEYDLGKDRRVDELKEISREKYEEAMKEEEEL